MANSITMGPMGFFGLAFGFVALIGGSYWIGQQKRDVDPLTEYNTQFDAYQDSVVKPILAQADSLRRVSDSTKAIADSAQYVANKQTGVITKLQSTIAVLRETNRTLSDSVKSDSTLPPVCDQCRRAVISLTHEVDSLNTLTTQQEIRDTTRVVTITQLNASLLTSNTRGDSLQKVIINFPAPPRPNRFLGVTLPRIPSQYVIIGAIGTGLLIAR